MYLKCGVKKVMYFPACFFFYALNAIGVMLFTVFVSFPIWVILLSTGVDLTCYVELGLDGLDCVDQFWKGLTGYHLFHYPDYILDKCYYCDGIPHKGLYDHGLFEPDQPTFQAPPFPQVISNAINQIGIDYDPDTGTIPLRLKSMGKFLGNDTKNVPDWEISEGIDSTIASNFNTASSNLNVFNTDANQLITDFKVNIPNAFSGAEQKLKDGGNELKSVFGP